jgi:hypothetical protein
MSNNAAALDRGFKKLYTMIDLRMLRGLSVEANKLAMKAYETYRSPLMGFTGNTWTGTVVGVFINHRFVYMIGTRAIGNMPAALRKKLTRGETAFLKEPYGYIMKGVGNNRRFTGKVSTDQGNSEQDAIAFLNGYVPKGRWAIVVVNGSEYGNYIENEMGGDVLIGTYRYAKNLRIAEIAAKV